MSTHGSGGSKAAEREMKQQPAYAPHPNCPYCAKGQNWGKEAREEVREGREG